MEFGPLARFERNRKGVTRAELKREPLFWKPEKIFNSFLNQRRLRFESTGKTMLDVPVNE